MNIFFLGDFRKIIYKSMLVYYFYMNPQRILSRLANNYSSLPVNIVRGKDIFLWGKNMLIY